jgi:hypothetical protein
MVLEADNPRLHRFDVRDLDDWIDGLKGEQTGGDMDWDEQIEKLGHDSD